MDRAPACCRCGGLGAPAKRSRPTAATRPDRAHNRRADPRGAKNMKILRRPTIRSAYAVDKEQLDRVRCRAIPKGSSHAGCDSGASRVVRQKGSATRCDRTDFAANVLRYRWKFKARTPTSWYSCGSRRRNGYRVKPTATGTYVFTAEVHAELANQRHESSSSADPLCSRLLREKRLAGACTMALLWACSRPQGWNLTFWLGVSATDAAPAIEIADGRGYVG